jgi:hypothetical protein
MAEATVSRTPENFAAAYIAQRLSRHSDRGRKLISLIVLNRMEAPAGRGFVALWFIFNTITNKNS